MCFINRWQDFTALETFEDCCMYYFLDSAVFFEYNFCSSGCFLSNMSITNLLPTISFSFETTPLFCSIMHLHALDFLPVSFVYRTSWYRQKWSNFKHCCKVFAPKKILRTVSASAHGAHIWLFWWLIKR